MVTQCRRRRHFPFLNQHLINHFFFFFLEISSFTALNVVAIQQQCRHSTTIEFQVNWIEENKKKNIYKKQRTHGTGALIEDCGSKVHWIRWNISIFLTRMHLAWSWKCIFIQLYGGVYRYVLDGHIGECMLHASIGKLLKCVTSKWTIHIKQSKDEKEKRIWAIHYSCASNQAIEPFNLRIMHDCLICYIAWNPGFDTVHNSFGLSFMFYASCALHCAVMWWAVMYFVVKCCCDLFKDEKETHAAFVWFDFILKFLSYI